MKNIFIDTNIIVDLIADRKPFSKYAIQLFKSAEEKRLALFVSSHSIATTHYILKKYLDEQSLRNVLYELIGLVSVIPIDFDILKKGLRSKHTDFEDGLQILSVMSVKNIDFIVTRNIKDFKLSEIPVFAPEEACDRI